LDYNDITFDKKAPEGHLPNMRGYFHKLVLNYCQNQDNQD